ncbi:hypothetical protein Poly51_12950 [Rubripirellula tenax]|uniref:Uncharacterized protein n=1 Tax=Rubripirellula tenax TaxID=2528015 RepID=A0A5C6FEH9_9BACT|nr:hypothetical protein Poly51_12950 [Rubripirellula tenax]
MPSLSTRQPETCHRCHRRLNSYGQYEQDTSLYINKDTGQYFIVESEEFVSGPDVRCSHQVKPLTQQELEALVSTDAELAKKCQQMTAESP